MKRKRDTHSSQVSFSLSQFNIFWSLSSTIKVLCLQLLEIKNRNSLKNIFFFCILYLFICKQVEVNSGAVLSNEYICCHFGFAEALLPISSLDVSTPTRIKCFFHFLTRFLTSIHSVNLCLPSQQSSVWSLERQPWAALCNPWNTRFRTKQ